MHFRRLTASVAGIAVLSAASFVYVSHPARSSDHQDSPATVARPPADITDVFFFPSPTNRNNVEVVMNVVPLIPAGDSHHHFLDPNVLYQFKFAHGNLGTTAPADFALQLTASGTGPGQKIQLYEKHGSGESLGLQSTTGTPIGFPISFNRPAGTLLPDGINAFVGPRADPFFFDLFQFFKILPDRLYSNPRTGDALGTKTPTFNGFAPGSRSGAASGNYACSDRPSTNAFTQINGGFDVISIVLDVPRTLLVSQRQSPLVHLWATASTATNQRYNDKVVYDQLELLSRPAVKEVFEVFADHRLSNTREPYDDPAIHHAVSYFMTNVAGRSPAIANVVTSVLYPNEMSADLSQYGVPAAYLGVETGGATGSKFGGRALTDDVIDISLGVIFGKTIPALGLAADDRKENNCLANEHVYSGQGGRQTQDDYPYVTTPH